MGRFIDLAIRIFEYLALAWQRQLAYVQRCASFAASRMSSWQQWFEILSVFRSTGLSWFLPRNCFLACPGVLYIGPLKLRP